MSIDITAKETMRYNQNLIKICRVRLQLCQYEANECTRLFAALGGGDYGSEGTTQIITPSGKLFYVEFYTAIGSKWNVAFSVSQREPSATVQIHILGRFFPINK